MLSIIFFAISQLFVAPAFTAALSSQVSTIEAATPAMNFIRKGIVLPEKRNFAQSEDVIEQFVFPDSARIILIGQSGQEKDIGKVVFSQSDDEAIGISVEMDHDQFVDQFLSMRPFRCLTESSEWFCYLPYPYDSKKTITATNLTDLEYQLLFIWKSPKDFGIDAWNGVYYKLELQSDGTLRGELLQGDLNVLADPPEPYSYPIDLEEFISEGAKNRLYPSLIIRP